MEKIVYNLKFNKILNWVIIVEKVVSSHNQFHLLNHSLMNLQICLKKVSNMINHYEEALPKFILERVYKVNLALTQIWLNKVAL